MFSSIYKTTKGLFLNWTLWLDCSTSSFFLFFNVVFLLHFIFSSLRSPSLLTSIFFVFLKLDVKTKQSHNWDRAANHYNLTFWVSRIVGSLYCSTSQVNGDCYSSLRWLQYLQWLLRHLISLLYFKGNLCWLYCINPGIKKKKLIMWDIYLKQLSYKIKTNRNISFLFVSRKV